MIHISNIKMTPVHTQEDLLKAIRKEGVSCSSETIEIVKKSLDARKKKDIHYVYSVDVAMEEAERICKKSKNPNIVFSETKKYELPVHGSACMRYRPLIIGTGPAGLFAGLLLAENGYRPILIERGAPVEERAKDVNTFWKTGILRTNSNVQFGEGGAGTFSDGKLNTGVKDPSRRIRKVLETFVDAGADPSILYYNKPHIGTDVLQQVVRNLRRRILDCGGEIHFHTQAVDFLIQEDSLKGVIVECEKGERQEWKTDHVILAAGHSARDTFAMLKKRQVPMTAKSFAVGLRIEHPQDMINEAQYGKHELTNLPAADYKLAAQTEQGRSVYSFCMCPGGQVVKAASEKEMLAVNGMSLAARSGRNANAALVVAVTKADYPGADSLAGMEYQRNLERLAYQEGEGQIPIQLLADFRQNCKSTSLGQVVPDLCGSYAFANLRNVLPEGLSKALLEAMDTFGRRLKGFDRPDAILAGVESRTSSPVRIERNAQMESRIQGLFPCGEGAGYAGGITSAAVDGIKVAEELIRRYKAWI